MTEWAHGKHDIRPDVLIYVVKEGFISEILEPSPKQEVFFENEFLKFSEPFWDAHYFYVRTESDR